MHTHYTHTGLCGSRCDTGLINDFITVEALNGAQGEVRISDVEWSSRAVPSVLIQWVGFLSTCCNTLPFCLSSVWTSHPLSQSFCLFLSPALPWSVSQISAAGCLQRAGWRYCKCGGGELSSLQTLCSLPFHYKAAAVLCSFTWTESDC